MKKKIILVYLFVMGMFIFGATEERALKVKDFSSEKRVALVIGNSQYKFNPLKNPENDAEDISKELKKLGFDVILRKNLDKRGMATAIKEFGEKIRNGGVGLFYFAGHGVQIEGENYLIPLNQYIQTEEDVEFEAIKANRVLAEMERAGNKMNIIILDACRNNPFESSSRGGSRGLARMDAPTGSLLVYSTSPGKTALDGENARNGVFTESLLKELRINPNVDINDLLINVRTRVIGMTDSAQIPWESSSLTGKFYFARSTEDEYESFRKEQTDGLKEFEFKESNLKDVIKRRAEYRLKMDEEFKSIESMESDDFITPEEKIILWREYLTRFSDDNPYKDGVEEKIRYWEENKYVVKTEDKVYSESSINFEDYFYDNRNDWYEIDTTDQKVKIESDGYTIYNKTSLQKTWKKDILDDLNDFEIKTTLSKISGYNNNGINILFGSDNNSTRYYIFGTTGTGYYSLFKYDNGWNAVIPWEKSDSINGDNSTNVLKIEKRGKTLYLYINDIYVNKVENFESFGPAIGFAVNPDIEAKVKSLVIKSNGNNLILEENFRNNNNNWYVERGMDKKLIVENNSYTIYNKDYFQKTWLNNIIETDNFELEVDIQWISGIENNAMNVIFGSDLSGENYFTFGISSHGQYIVSRYTGVWENLIDWTQSPYISKGASTNKIKVVKKGNIFEFYINGNYVNKTQTSSWYGSAVGFGINAGIETKINSMTIKAAQNENSGLKVASEMILMSEEFNDNGNNWVERNSDGINLQVKNGGYKIYSKDQYYKSWQNNMFSSLNDDFEIESKIRKNTGKDNNIYGILFGVNNEGSKYYTFGVSANGYYAVFKYDNAWQTPINWKTSSYINSGNAENTLKIKREGRIVYFYINGNYVDKIDDYEGFGKTIGIGVASDIDITVDNIYIKKINVR